MPFNGWLPGSSFKGSMQSKIYSPSKKYKLVEDEATYELRRWFDPASNFLDAPPLEE